MLLVAGALLPVVLFAVAVVSKLSDQEQLASERRALSAARNLAGTVEREVSSTTRTLQALAASEKLDQINLKLFYGEAVRVARTQSTWLTVVLLTPDGRQLINTRHPFAMPLPGASELGSLRRVVATRQPLVGDLAVGRSGQRLAFPIRVPVIRNGKLRYVLTAVITPQALASVVKEQSSVDGEWTRTVVDGQGFVVARTRNPDRFVGKRGTPSFLKRISESPEGVYRDTTLEGEKVYVAFSRLDNSRWTAAVTVPVAVIQGPSQRAMGLVVGSGLALLLLSGAGALVLSRRISRGITLAAQAAEALARGDRPQVMASPIKEVALLEQSLQFSADLLLQREKERSENLQRAEAAREEAEAANRIKDEFLAVLSHELRSPLNPIVGWSKLLRSGTLDEAKTAHALETIERNAKLQTQLIEDLLDVSRILQGKLSLQMAPVNLALTAEAALETVRLAAEAKSIQIQTSLNTFTGRVLGDAARLQQVICNLLSNAVKFTPEGGKVEIGLEQVDTHVHLRVRDTGKGIPEDFLPHVFEYFRQADSGITRQFGGLGLGLAIVRHLVELHGGIVQAESLGPGQGATFTVRLPLMTEEVRGQPADTDLLQTASSLQPLHNVRILLVDDEVDSRDVIGFVLEDAGAIVIPASSGIEALEMFPQLQPDVLISDIGMPGIDGYMLIQKIRALPADQGGQVLAIALTAYAGELNQQQAIAAGFYYHLAKPIEPDDLIRDVAMLVKKFAMID